MTTDEYCDALFTGSRNYWLQHVRRMATIKVNYGQEEHVHCIPELDILDEVDRPEFALTEYTVRHPDLPMLADRESDIPFAKAEFVRQVGQREWTFSNWTIL
jgi:hypothetical protein